MKHPIGFAALLAIPLATASAVRLIDNCIDPQEWKRVAYKEGEVVIGRYESGKTAVRYNGWDFSTLVDDDGDGIPDHRDYIIPGRYAFVQQRTDHITDAERDLFKKVLEADASTPSRQ